MIERGHRLSCSVYEDADAFPEDEFNEIVKQFCVTSNLFDIESNIYIWVTSSKNDKEG